MFKHKCSHAIHKIVYRSQFIRIIIGYIACFDYISLIFLLIEKIDDI